MAQVHAALVAIFGLVYGHNQSILKESINTLTVKLGEELIRFIEKNMSDIKEDLSFDLENIATFLPCYP